MSKRYAVKDTEGKIHHMEVKTSIPILPEGWEVVGETPVEIADADTKFLKEETEGVIVVDDTAKLQSLREATLQVLRDARAPLIVEADIEINKLLDAGSDYSAWSTYRQALRDVTNLYKDGNGDANDQCDSLVVSEFVWPTKP